MARPAFCIQCGHHIDECGPVSTRGLCERCGDQNCIDNTHQMREREGPYYEWWIARTHEGVTRELMRAAEKMDARATG